MTRPVALTGTPGVGKTRVATSLAPSVRSIEVGALAARWGLARPLGPGVEVDLPRLQAAARRPSALASFDLVVGHLAHLLPLRDVIVLRCHPEELARRLAHARRGTPAERRENYAAEALDVVLAEAVGPGRRVWEVDTTGRSVAAVARDVALRWRRRGPPAYGETDWLADPTVTAHLLDRRP